MQYHLKSFSYERDMDRSSLEFCIIFVKHFIGGSKGRGARDAPSSILFHYRLRTTGRYHFNRCVSVNGVGGVGGGGGGAPQTPHSSHRTGPGRLCGVGSVRLAFTQEDGLAFMQFWEKNGQK